MCGRGSWGRDEVWVTDVASRDSTGMFVPFCGGDDRGWASNVNSVRREEVPLSPDLEDFEDHSDEPEAAHYSC